MRTTIIELLQKFENGEERFQKDALFNQCINMLVRGADPLKVLDEVLQIQSKTLKEYISHVNNGPPPIILLKNEIKKS